MSDPEPQKTRLFYRRRLPHWHPNGAIIFVTYRLAGSMPPAALAAVRAEKRRLLRESHRPDENERDRSLRLGNQLFTIVDQALAAELRDNSLGARISPRWLSDERIAGLVRDNLRFWDGIRFDFHRYVIMPNHVHILIEPLKVGQAVSLPMGPNSQAEDARHALADILHSLKGYTARKANQVLARTGPFWQDESYDHWVRDEEEYARIVEYLDTNPVKAGLCSAAEQWEWSSAAEDAMMPFAQTGSHRSPGSD